MKLYLVDGPAEPFRPLACTRPLSELLFGAETFRERIERLSGMSVEGVLAQGRFECLPFSRLSSGPVRVNPLEEIGGPLLVLDSLYIPTGSADPAFGRRARPARFWLGGAMVGGWLAERDARAVVEAAISREDWRDAAREGEDVELPGRRPSAIHRLVARNAEQIAADLEGAPAGGGRPGSERPVGAGVAASNPGHGPVRERGASGDRERGGGGASGGGGPTGASGSAGAREAGAEIPAPGVAVEGPRERLQVDPRAELVGPIHVDVREGAVRLEAGVRVEPFSILRGPLVVRRGTRLLGSEIGGSTIGPGCKIRGDVQSSVFLGYSNKAHEGFVGDSYVGEWVNLGAGTTTSNLKNNYGYIRLRLSHTVLETGLLKLGSLIGDHVKTGIGTLLPTGAWIGPGTNLYGTAGPAPPFLPAFSWGAGTLQETHRLEAFLESARRMMERRGVKLEAEEVGMLGAVFRATEPDRIPA